MSISFLLDEKPTVVLISSVGERSGRDDRQVRRYNQGSARCRYRTMSPQKGFNSATALLFDPVCHECGSHGKRRLQQQENRIRRGEKWPIRRRFELIDASEKSQCIQS